MNTLPFVVGCALIIGIGSIIFFIFLRPKILIDSEQLKKQRNALIAGVILFFLIGIITGIISTYSPELMESVFIYPPLGVALILTGVWLLFYGLRHIYLLIKSNFFGVSFLAVLIFWLIAIYLFFNAFYTKFSSLGWV